MAREILFKAKRKYDGEWVEGSPVFYESGEVAIFDGKFTRYGHEATQIWKRTLVDKDTICQYTGLTDKNGNKIWENDIVKQFAGKFIGIPGLVEIARVFYEEQDSAFKVLHNSDKTAFFMDEKSVYEVIGNIFDNPELLKEE